MKVPFFKQDCINLNYTSALHVAIDEIVAGRNNMVLGELTGQFETSFANYLGSPHFVFLSNGLDALILALKALELGPSDEVIVPCHTYIATWIAPLTLGCKLVVVPVRADNYLIDESCLRKYVTSKTKCIMPVHLYGNACDMLSIMNLAKEYGLFVVEDAAQAHGCSIDQKYIGTFGDLTCFSFYPTKNLGAFGEAGGISTYNPLLAEKIMSLRNYGRSGLDGSSNIYLSGNSRGDELQAAFLSEKLNYLSQISELRRNIISRYSSNLSLISSHFSLIKYEPGSAPHLAIGTFSDSSLRPSFVELLKAKGVDTAIHYKKPCHLQSFLKPSDLAIDHSCIEQAQNIADQIISLPMSECHTLEEIDFVCSLIIDFFS